MPSFPGAILGYVLGVSVEMDLQRHFNCTQHVF
jgi:hypothetical protein